MRSTRFRLHVGIEGGREEGDGEGEKGVEGGKVAVRVLHGRVGRVSAGAIALLSRRGNSTQAREQAIYMLHKKLRYSHTFSSTHSLRFVDRRGLCHRLLKVASRGLIIKYFLDNRIAASRFVRVTCGHNDQEYLLLFKLRQQRPGIAFVCRNPSKDKSVMP